MVFEGLWSTEHDLVMFSMFTNTFWNIYITIYIKIKLWTAGQEHWSTRRTFFQVPWHRGLPIACQWRVWFLKRYFENVSYAESKSKRILIYRIINWGVLLLFKEWSYLEFWKCIKNGKFKKMITNWVSLLRGSIKTNYKLISIWGYPPVERAVWDYCIPFSHLIWIYEVLHKGKWLPVSRIFKLEGSAQMSSCNLQLFDSIMKKWEKQEEQSQIVGIIVSKVIVTSARV